MEEDPQLDALDYLDRFFEEIRRHARQDAEFAARLVKALGGEVVFEADRAVDIVNPLELAATSSREKFDAVFETMTLAQIKAVMKKHNLGTTVDAKGLAKPALIEMLHARAVAKARERGATHRGA